MAGEIRGEEIIRERELSWEGQEWGRRDSGGALIPVVRRTRRWQWQWRSKGGGARLEAAIEAEVGVMLVSVVKARGGGGLGSGHSDTWSCGSGSGGGGGGKSPSSTLLEQPLEREITSFFLQMTARVCGGISSPLIEPKMG